MLARLGLAAVVLFAGCGDDGGGGSAPAPVVLHETYFTQTADDWTIAVHHYHRSTGVAYAEPVFMSGGYLENHRVFDAFPRHSLIGELALSGFDVWTYDIRGTGQSQSPEVGDLFGWTFSADEFIKYDTPAALDFVRRTTGAAQVNWVAHSMGATMLYGYLERYDPSHVKNAVTLGGVGMLSDEAALESGFGDLFFQIGTFLLPFIPSNMPLPLRWALDQLLAEDPWRWAAICYALDSFLGRLFWSDEAVNPNLIYQFLTKGLCNTSTNVFKQFLRWARDGRVVGDDGYDYTANLPRITTPICVMSGGGDQMVKVADCRYVYDRIASTDKQWVECSKATGHTYDFGHVDMVLGLKAQAEVYGHVTGFLTARSTAR